MTTTRPSPTTTRPSGSIREMPRRPHEPGRRLDRSGSTTRPSPTATRRSGSTPDRPGLRQSRQRSGRYEGLRQGHRRPDEAIRLDPKDALAYGNRAEAWNQKDETTRPSPTTTRPSGSTPRMLRPTPTGATPGGRRRNTTRPSPISTRPSGSIPSSPGPMANRGMASGMRRTSRTRPSPISTRRSGSTPGMPGPSPSAATPGGRRANTTRPSPIYDEAIRLDPKDAWVRSQRAWVWATCPNANYRDGKKAVEEARLACELAGWKEASALSSLAAACAEAGDFDAAVRWQTRAGGLVPDGEDRSKYEARLKLYRATRPYREARP